jgi:hypothetical protein
MNARLLGKWLVLSAGLVCGVATAGQGDDGALLTFKVSSEALPEAGSTRRASVESSVLVAFNEKFAMRANPFRVELTAANEVSSAGITVTLFDTRAESPVLVGTEKVNVPVSGSSTAHMTGADGTAYAVAVHFKRAQLPAGNP